MTIYAGSDYAGPSTGLWAAGLTRQVIKDRWSKRISCAESGFKSRPDPETTHRKPELNLRVRGSAQWVSQLGTSASLLASNADGAPDNRICCSLIEGVKRLRMQSAVGQNLRRDTHWD